MFVFEWIEPNFFLKYNLLTTAVHNFYYIMSNGVHIPPDKDDSEPCVSIGIRAGPSDTKDVSGVVIGGGCLMDAPDAGKNIVIGGGIMRSSTSTTITSTWLEM